MTVKERRRLRREAGAKSSKIHTMKELIAKALGCSTDYLVFLISGDGRTDNIPLEKVKPLRQFVIAHGRKLGHVYNYDLYEMATFNTVHSNPLVEYQQLFSNSNRFDVCFCLDKTKLERR